ncbi:hypothetical protein B0T39_20315 [Chromobacterium haemolyticum]|nr:hypothetical protein B0T39_20315 [Chromobacterium haemolyticum]
MPAFSQGQRPLNGATSFTQEMQRVQNDIVQSIAKGFDQTPLRAALYQREALRLPAQKSRDDTKANFADKRDFIAGMLPLARQAAAKIGVSEDLILAHAALESAWGNKPITAENGSNGYNLFGIKASLNWSGKKAGTMTKEYLAGQLVGLEDTFRVYGSYQQSFDDYANLLSSQARYQNVLGSGSDAQRFGAELAKAGYATDPGYAAKISEVAAEIAAIKQGRTNQLIR